MKKVAHGFNISYDEFTDTLYISKDKPKKASSIIDENYIIVRKSENEICGITIDSFKIRHIDKSWNDNVILKYLPQFHLEDINFIS